MMALVKGKCPLCGIKRLERRAHLAAETAAIQKVRDDMGSKFQQAADALFTVTVAPHVFNEWLAALDAILEGRKK